MVLGSPRCTSSIFTSEYCRAVEPADGRHSAGSYVRSGSRSQGHERRTLRREGYPVSAFAEDRTYKSRY